MSVQIASPDRLRRRLAGQLPGYLERLGAEPVGELCLSRPRRPDGGQSNETVLFDAQWSCGGEVRRTKLVLRLQPDEHRVFLDADVVAEGHLLEDLSRHSRVPVPDVIAVEPDARVLGRPFLLMAHVAGRVPGGRPSIHRDPWLMSLTAAQRRDLSLNGLDALARVHATDWSRLPAMAQRAKGLDRQLEQLRRWYDWARGSDRIEIVEAGIRELTAAPPRQSEPVLLWGDARPGNIIFADDLSVAAVIDWELAAIGPQEIDVGWWLMMDEFAERGARGEPLEGMVTRDEAVELYCQIANTGVADLDYYRLLASVRLAITLLPVARSLRERDIITASSRFAHDNVPTQMVARQLGLAEPELSADYRRLSRMDRPEAAG